MPLLGSQTAGYKSGASINWINKYAAAHALNLQAGRSTQEVEIQARATWSHAAQPNAIVREEAAAPA